MLCLQMIWLYVYINIEVPGFSSRIKLKLKFYFSPNISFQVFSPKVGLPKKLYLL